MPIRRTATTSQSKSQKGLDSGDANDERDFRQNVMLLRKEPILSLPRDQIDHIKACYGLGFSQQF